MTDAASEHVSIPHPAGGYLRGLVYRPTAPMTFAVCYVHGLGGVAAGEKSLALQAACARRGWPFVAFDFRGHGASSGTMTDLRCGGLLQDLDTIYRYLSERGIRQLFPVGSSMGGWAAAWFAFLNSEIVPACALLAPAFHFPQGLWSRLSESDRANWQQTGRLRLKNQWLDIELDYELIREAQDYPLERLLGSWHTPTLIYHGLCDELIPTGRVLDVVERMSDPRVELRLFKAGDHRLSEQKDEIAEEVCRFFARFTERIGPTASLV
jgi:pimeloyl-ACP methyl ester carboxylesterase